MSNCGEYYLTCGEPNTVGWSDYQISIKKLCFFLAVSQCGDLFWILVFGKLMWNSFYTPKKNSWDFVGCGFQSTQFKY